MDGHVTILLVSIVVILFVYIGIPLGTSRYTEKELHDLLPNHVHETNGYKIYEGTPIPSVSNQKYFP